MSKELYIAEVERIMDELIHERGIHPDIAYAMASDRAYDSMRDRLADMGDMARKKERGE